MFYYFHLYFPHKKGEEESSEFLETRNSVLQKELTAMVLKSYM